MTGADKIGLVDRLLSELSQLEKNSDMPVMVGTLTTPQGIRGFEVAMIGHPVFEARDRYIIYLKSVLPVQGVIIMVAVPYYKETLKSIIQFNHNDKETQRYK